MVACVVIFLFLIGLTVSIKGVQWVRNFFKCCQNKLHNLPSDQSKDGDIERKETGLAGNAADPIGHQPSSQVAPPLKNSTRPLIPLADSDGASAILNDLNSTGQQLLSQGGKQSHDDHPSTRV